MEALSDSRQGLGTHLADKRERPGKEDRRICEEIRIPSEVLSKGTGRDVRQMAVAAARVNAMWQFLRNANANDFGSREAS